eukprot:3401050-Rhodomonas_salina.3
MEEEEGERRRRTGGRRDEDEEGRRLVGAVLRGGRRQCRIAAWLVGCVLVCVYFGAAAAQPCDQPWKTDKCMETEKIVSRSRGAISAVLQASRCVVFFAALPMKIDGRL